MKRNLRLKSAFIERRAVGQIIDPLRNTDGHCQRQMNDSRIATGTAGAIAHRCDLRIPGHHAHKRVRTAHAFLANEQFYRAVITRWANRTDLASIPLREIGMAWTIAHLVSRINEVCE